MAKKKQENYTEAIEGNILASIRLAKAQYELTPTNPLYSIIIGLELTLAEVKKLK